MPVSEAQRRAADKYNREKMDELKIKCRKELGAKIRSHAEECEESISKFLTRAALNQIERDKDVDKK